MVAAAERTSGFAFLSGGGEIGALIAARDWSGTSLGALADWDQILKSTVSIILRSQVPMVVLWGPGGILIYNDAFAVIAGGRHPHVLGINIEDGWPEVADFNRHVMDVCLRGETLTYRDQELELHRSGKPEKVWMNLDYSPVLGVTGRPAGVLAIVVETTEKVTAERWRASELDRQRQMFEQAPGFMAMLSGPEHVFDLTNIAFMQLVGHRDVLGLPVRAALPEIAGQGFFELLDGVYETGEAFVGHSMPAQLQRLPGAQTEGRFLDLIYQPVRNSAGDVVGIFAQGSDVTDREIAEAALRESESRFRTFADVMPNQVWTSAPDGKLNWFNPQVYTYAGAEPGDFDGENWTTIVHPEDLAPTADAWKDALSTGLFYEAEFRLRRSDGEYRWHIVRAVPIRDRDGALVQWIGTNTDIHDQRIVAEALAESERRLKLSQDAAGISALELDMETGTVFGADGFWGLWGLSPRASEHISVLEGIVIPEDAEVRSTPETRQNGTATPNVEYRIRRPDTGELRWLSRNIDFVHDNTGKPIKMYGVLQDITARKESQARQEMLAHELEHRIKNILATVAAIASQTFRNTDIESGRKVFNERLRALAKAHDLLNDTRWTEASMRQVIESTVSIFPPDQIRIDGPPISIGPKMALSLALAVNELGTNALKYGALSVATGIVTIEWGFGQGNDEDDETLLWRWKESGGPPVSSPTRRGFGTFLVESVLAADFEGSVRMEYHLEGVECVLKAPMPDATASFVTSDGEYHP